MTARITYIAEGQFDPQHASVEKDSLSVQGLKGAREIRITVGFEKLPHELRQVLKQSRELHVRWATERSFAALAPFGSRISPGLHVSYTPPENRRVGVTLLCPFLRKVFSDTLKCSIPDASFISSSVASTRSVQFYQLIPSLENLVTYIQQKICRQEDHVCYEYASTLEFADYADIDYEATSSFLSITSYWSQAPHEEGWRDNHKFRGEGRVEVGILTMQEPTGPAELRVGGFLAVVGENESLKPTLFSFPSRHQPLPDTSTYRTSFVFPTGLHPTLKLSIPRGALSPPATAPKGACSLHAFLTLPSSIFADKYQLSTTDRLFLQSHNLVSLRSIAGETDLEVPDWVTERWGSHLLFELATQQPNNLRNQSDDWEATIPLHLRYLHPSASGYRNISVPWPVVFWACSGEEGRHLEKSPFDRTHLHWDELFTPRTIFYQLHPAPTGAESRDDLNPQRRLIEQIQVPVLRIDKGSPEIAQARVLELSTVFVIVFGFLWVLWKLGLVIRSHGVGRNNTSKVKNT
ncbi:hypothetical protein VTO42DRAFT_5639 [Malbranchea cinnamomea]